MRKNQQRWVQFLLLPLMLLAFVSVRTVQAESEWIPDESLEESSDPVQQTGWQQIDSHWYYFNAEGIAETGWVKVNNTWYYMDSTGVMQTGWHKLNGRWYYLNASGAMQTGRTQTREGGYWYYMSSSGAMQTGWQKVNSRWYYLNPSGAMQTGWTKVGNTWYYMSGSGSMQTGWQRVNGRWYYLNASGAMQTGWTKVGNTWYYMSGSGTMQTGWHKLNGRWYYLNPSGAMQTGWTKVGNTWYYMNGSGAMQTGWQKVNDRWYYLNPSGAMQTSQINLGGVLYSFYASGALKSSQPADVRKTTPEHMKNLGASEQVILVTTSKMNTYHATVRTFEKDHSGKWQQLLNAKAYIGRRGFTDNKREGDGRTPTGKYTIGYAFGHGSKPNTRLSYKRATSNDVWVDDSNSKYYNTWQQKNNPQKDWRSAESMNHELYKYGFVINYNTAQIPGAGSAIFMHVARPSTGYTAGCVATSESHLLNILSRVDPAKKPVIIQDAESNLGRY